MILVILGHMWSSEENKKNIDKDELIIAENGIAKTKWRQNQ